MGSFVPSVYVVEPTNRCNIQCIMCPNHQFSQDQLGDIGDSNFAQVMEEISPFAELVMLYFLGESTLHGQFPSLLKTARKLLKGRIVVSTNGFDLSESVIDALVKNVDIIIICIDRWDADLYERVRVGSSFAKVVASAEQLLNSRHDGANPTIIVKGLDIRLPQEGKVDIQNEAREFEMFWRARGAVPLVGWLNTWAGQFPNLIKLSTKPNPYVDDLRSACADLWFKMVINWRGEVVLCCHDWSSSQVLGVLQKGRLLDIWQSQSLVELRIKHLKGDYKSNVLCGTCKEWGVAEEMESYVRLNYEDYYRVF